MIWNIVKLLVAAWIIKTCVIENDLVQGFEEEVRQQFNAVFKKKEKKGEEK